MSDGRQMHVATVGLGQPLVFVHGWPEFWLTWMPVVNKLKDDFKCIMPCLYGFGLSDKPNALRDDLNAEFHANDILQLVEKTCEGKTNDQICNFIDKVISELGLDIKIICARVEEIAHENEHRESYDICLSRAVSNISTLNEFSLPLLKLHGKSICMKGNNISNEIIRSCLLYTSPSPRDS